jgi:LPXTG-site transpeptidase (sortase) family protein
MFNDVSQIINKRSTPYLIPFGIMFISLALALFIIFFSTPLKMEVNYWLYRQEIKNSVSDGMYETASNESLSPIPDQNFSIIIPKIGARSAVIPDVDPFDPSDYQYKLTKGVAHAKGSSTPGEEGNTFIFSHSTDTLLNSGRYNAVFYLLSKLEAGDSFNIVYKSEIYSYEVVKVLVVGPEQIQYLGTTRPGSYVTLMTCWPAGTAWKRLIVEAELLSPERP